MSRVGQLRGVWLYLAISVPYLAIPLALYPLGVSLQAGVSLAGIAAIASSIVAARYVRSETKRVEDETGENLFLGMLRSAIEVKVAFGAWIGYLVAARLLAENGLPLVGKVLLPIPPEPVRLIVNAVAGIVVLTSTVYYAVTIVLERRDAEREAEEIRAAVRERGMQ